MDFSKNEDLIDGLKSAIRRESEKVYRYYKDKIRSDMPEYELSPPRYDNPQSAYFHFFGCIVDQAGLPADTIWRNMRKLKEKNPELLNPSILLQRYPEPKNCSEKNKLKADCPAKHFLDDTGLQFQLQQTHHWFKAAHFFEELKKIHGINSILDVKNVDKYRDPLQLYTDLNNLIYKSTKNPKTLSLAFRVMTENQEGRPGGENRFWSYKAEDLVDIPIPVDFWIAFITLRMGLLEPEEKDTPIPIDTDIKERTLDVWSEIGRDTSVPPIFLDPLLWKIGGQKCTTERCKDCFFNSILDFFCPRKEIQRLSKKRLGRKTYYLYQPEKNRSLPQGFETEFRQKEISKRETTCR